MKDYPFPFGPLVPPPSFEKDDGIEIRVRIPIVTHYPMWYGVFTMPDEPAEDDE